LVDETPVTVSGVLWVARLVFAGQDPTLSMGSLTQIPTPARHAVGDAANLFITRLANESTAAQGFIACAVLSIPDGFAELVVLA
jgi:hypothetical protein